MIDSNNHILLGVFINGHAEGSANTVSRAEQLHRPLILQNHMICRSFYIRRIDGSSVNDIQWLYIGIIGINPLELILNLSPPIDSLCIGTGIAVNILDLILVNVPDTVHFIPGKIIRHPKIRHIPGHHNDGPVKAYILIGIGK